MASLKAWYRLDGRGPALLWEHPLPAGRDVTLGQTADPAVPPEVRSDLGLNVPGVSPEHRALVSARHVTLRWDESDLTVELRARPVVNPAAFDGVSYPNGRFAVPPGRSFTITKFFEFELIVPDPVPDHSLPFPADAAPVAYSFIDCDALVVELRDVIGKYNFGLDEVRLAGLIVKSLRHLLPAASAVAIVAGCHSADPHVLTEKVPKPGAGVPDVRFNKTLARRVAARARGEVAHWAGGVGSGDVSSSVAATSDWAVCAPVLPAAGGVCERVIYVGGRFPEGGVSSAADLADRPELRQTQEVVRLFAGVYVALVRLRRQQVEKDQLLKFLPQPVRVLATRGALDTALVPEPVKVAVLFCDLRGSCGLAEDGGADLKAFWASVLKPALELMAGAVAAQGGVIGSFLGDAVMAFWGWPDADDRMAEKAARAALAIRTGFGAFNAGRADGRTLGYGVGIASGYAMAGVMGVPAQLKVDVIGPTVNLSARLEGLTKAFGASVLIDAETKRCLPGGLAVPWRWRRIGWVFPHGIDTPVEVYDLLPADTADSLAPASHLCGLYEDALARFEAGEWRQARETLRAVAEFDAPSQFLAERIGSAHAPPAGWPGWAEHKKCMLKLEVK